jgi:hypothetical protein
MIHTECIRAIKRALDNGVILCINRNCCAVNCTQYSIQLEIKLNVCDVCYAEDNDILVSKAYTKFRVQHPNIPRFDLFIATSVNDQFVVFGIEIFNTHQTDAFNYDRLAYDWIEIRALRNIIDNLNTAQHGSRVILNDMRNYCRACVNGNPIHAPIIVRQCGAGSGKTYGIIADLAHLIRDCGKRVFVYVSKTHSAIGTIRNESIDCGCIRKSHDFEFIAGDRLDPNDANFIEFKNNLIDNITCAPVNGSRTRLQFQHAVFHDNNVTIPFVSIFATIDSLMYNMYVQRYGNVDIPPNDDTFEYRVAHLLSDLDNFNPVNDPRRLSITNWLNIWNKLLPQEFIDIISEANTHIFVDEAQDLNAQYVAVLGCLTHKGVSMTIVGDAMQAVYDTVSGDGDVAISHALELIESPHDVVNPTNAPRSRLETYFPYIFSQPITVQRNNQTWRCRHRMWPELINHLCRDEFQRSHVSQAVLPSTSDIYDSGILIEVWVIPKSDKYKLDNTNILRDILKDNVNKFHNESNYELIMPFVKGCATESTKLENIAQRFWETNTNHLNISDNQSYVMRHMSQESEPIDLRKSEDLMRIMSIHASKGTGREIIIWWNANDMYLECFDVLKRREPIAISECLRYVALTRHKRKLILVCFSSSKLLQDISNASKDPRFVDKIKFKFGREHDNMDWSHLVESARIRETFSQNAVRYPMTCQFVINEWCNIGRDYHWIHQHNKFSQEITKKLTGNDMTEHYLLNTCLSARCSFLCWMYNRSALKSSGVTTNNIGIIAYFVNQSKSIVFNLVDSFSKFKEIWININKTCYNENYINPDQQLIIPVLTLRFQRILINQHINEKMYNFAHHVNRCIINIRNTPNNEQLITSFNTFLSEPENLKIVIIFHYINQQRLMCGHGVISENMIATILESIDRNIHHNEKTTHNCSSLDNVIMQLNIPIGRQMEFILSKKSNIMITENIYGHSRVFLRDDQEYICSKRNGIIKFNVDNNTCHLVLYSAKITELNYIGLVTESLILLRCIYLNSHIKKEGIISNWKKYIRNAHTFGIRYVTLNVEDNTDEIMFINDEEITKYIIGDHRTQDIDLERMFDDQIKKIFMQLEISSIEMTKVHTKRVIYTKMVKRAYTYDSQSDTTDGDNKHPIIGEILHKRCKEIVNCLHNNTTGNFDILHQIRDDLIQLIHTNWHEKINEVLYPDADEDEDEDADTNHALSSM